MRPLPPASAAQGPNKNAPSLPTIIQPPEGAVVTITKAIIIVIIIIIIIITITTTTIIIIITIITPSHPSPP
jgi:hypothetical protein